MARVGAALPDEPTSAAHQRRMRTEMDAITQFNARGTSASLAIAPSATAEAQRTLTVLVSYRLSEAGRKTSLLAGGDGRARQRATLRLPATRLHLVQVEPDGTARLKMRPQYRLNAEQRLVRVDLPPIYDHPPTVDELLQDAARNHELERGFYAQHSSRRISRREATQQWLDEVAREFFADPTKRAVPHPQPTPRMCQLATSRGSVAFDAQHMTGLPAKVPLEAFRRFHNDLRIRHGQAEIQRERDVRIDAERRRMMAEWIAEHGTDGQKERLAAGRFPKAEWIGVMTDHAFAPVAALPVFTPAGPSDLQALLRQCPGYESAIVTPADFRVVTRLLTEARPVEWEWLQWIRRRLPEASLHLRTRQLVWTKDPRAPWQRTVTVLVTMNVGPLSLRREFVVPKTAPLLNPAKEDACTTA